jgi:hypothetical protein
MSRTIYIVTAKKTISGIFGISVIREKNIKKSRNTPKGGLG